MWPEKLQGKTWTISAQGRFVGDVRTTTLTEADLRALYAAVPGGRDAMCAALGVAHLSDRKADRALALLKREGLIEYRAGKWLKKREP